MQPAKLNQLRSEVTEIVNDEIRGNVDHPSHYNQPGRKECIEEMRERFGDLAVYWFCTLSAFKYDYRKGNKEGNSEDQDSAKLEWYEEYGSDLKNNLTVSDCLKALAPWDERLASCKEALNCESISKSD